MLILSKLQEIQTLLLGPLATYKEEEEEEEEVKCNV